MMDVQQGIVERFGDPRFLERIANAIEIARDVGAPVIYVRVAFRPDHPEVSPHNKMFAVVSGTNSLLEEDSGIHPAVAPRPGDPIVTKRRVSAFSGSDLEIILRAQGISALTLCGVTTSGVVLSTVRQAADMDFELTVLADACADWDGDVHRLLVDKVFPRQANVIEVADWTPA